MENIKHYLEQAVQQNAADMFLIAGKAISMKCEGEIRTVDDERLMPEASEKLVRELYELAGRTLPEHVSAWDDDFSLSVPGLARFRVNVFQQRGSLAAVIRVVKFGIPDWRQLGLTDEIMKIAGMTRGLVLVTGPAGSGKSTTLACVVDAINQTRNAHIITIEDPIEYIHRNQKSVVSQRELNMDTESYVTALRASLRQAPDVILLGEMRDLDTIQTAMTAAETGHLVISTLHTVGAVNTIDRIIDVFPPQQQQQIRVQLSQVLKTVVSQQLLPTVNGGLVPAFEIMHLNNAVRTLVRDSRIHQIDSVIQTSAAEGMIGMDESILRLVKSGTISKETALRSAMSPDALQKKLGR
ncbi:MAG: PilT/PilU family type 4a pilus ATPase [Oscillospiraceae bacterium]|nr:PilT/PilU family type 4a pilus ATPase [Oscillospiraceae bacterium]